MNSIIRQISSLPPLSQTVIDTLDLSVKEKKTAEELIDIIKDDSLMVVMLLKTANSAIFGFRTEVDSIENLIHLLGIDFTISIILSNSLQNSFDVDFSPYGITSNEFRELTSLKISLLNQWIMRVDSSLIKKLVMPIILSDLGKYIVSTEINHVNKKDEFLKELTNTGVNSINSIEKQYCGISSNEATILLLEHWKLNPKIIELLKGKDSQTIHILDTINHICNVIKPLDEKIIQEELDEISKYDFNKNILEKAINKMITNIEDAL